MGVRFKSSDFVYLAIGVVLLAVLPLYFFYDPKIPGVFPSCPFLELTGWYCTGCGSQRALHDLLHLDFADMFRHNLLFFPAFLIIGHHGLLKILGRFTNKELPGIVQYTMTPRIVLIVVVVFTVVRNIELYPFTLLAP